MEYHKYGLMLNLQEFDEVGNLIKEKKELEENEKIIFERREEYYKGKSNGK